MKLILGRGNEAHTLTVVSEVVNASVEARNVEVHDARAGAIIVRGRPVVAVAAHIVDRSPVAVARSRLEDRTSLLQSASLRSGNRVAAVAGTTAVGVAQAVGVAAPVVGQQDYAIHIIHLGLGIADA